MRVIDLSEEHKDLFCLCLEDWSDEAKEAGPKRGQWVERCARRGLRAKLAVDEAGTVGGMIQYVPIEHSFVSGHGLYVIHCIWVHGPCANARSRQACIGGLCCEPLQGPTMRQSHYRHTQIGWVLIFTLIGLALLTGSLLAAADLPEWAGISAGVFLLLLLLLATLTVSVDTEQIRLRFGVGLIRRRFALRSVRHFSAVRNPWYFGWGIHFYPGRSIYNVSGFGAVQLVLDSGKRIRIGTDQPEPLRQAIEQVLGKPAPLTAAEVEQGKRSIKRGLIVSGVIVAAIAMLLGGLYHLEAQPPRVTLDAHRFKVESFIYDEEFVLGEITHVSLQNRIPGFASAPTGRRSGAPYAATSGLTRSVTGSCSLSTVVPPTCWCAAATTT